ncbi:HypC/HybG/HupF family hydrogenase formation chaperone [Pseudotabrizicola alkalilacus]|uniref:HypC/HybG/HupF family hydrogenase formation chaperone n=1 Tax=Pseudotabrizicola alkalilacus TaxID=2305252 RepID=A0A411Z4R7_9RHOB|nr:HypC/HybG/HupF family hydrogenase formation chaperone [Pseudotabrizicola alkalilacus]RGP38078.1 HypC/HybG/HupF family hydrogenase formation chaperone [Pseudotabrizicola alkalilacus]
MCVGIPMQVLAIDGIVGHAQDEHGVHLLDMSLLPDAQVGDWVLGFLGTARQILPETEALLIRKALQGMSSIMAGGDAGDAFADLDARTPRLPPHLQAALDAGQTIG